MLQHMAKCRREALPFCEDPVCPAPVWIPKGDPFIPKGNPLCQRDTRDSTEDSIIAPLPL